MLGRVKFEVNPVYPPEGSPEETKLAWMQMTPKDRRKYFIQQELDKCTAVTTVSAEPGSSRVRFLLNEAVGKGNGVHVLIKLQKMPHLVGGRVRRAIQTELAFTQLPLQDRRLVYIYIKYIIVGREPM